MMADMDSMEFNLAKWLKDNGCAFTTRQLAQMFYNLSMDLNALERLRLGRNCNNCKKRSKCKFLPKIGEPLRYNCPHWVDDGGDTDDQLE